MRGLPEDRRLAAERATDEAVAEGVAVTKLGFVGRLIGLQAESTRRLAFPFCQRPRLEKAKMNQRVGFLFRVRVLALKRETLYELLKAWFRLAVVFHSWNGNTGDYERS